ncbi:uncharacterized protein EKO05_0008878 [Ascochyta rabiei]|uniref:Uncharacterized protein n=1 Tax=Didymella rabiei TaxID=5454 RepID=A0A163ASF6_DIDRA|nr:uncharacterized protein EKO05_0008878 [Ascochyta rabiei]KZM21356.1 hypothetical protein ST47_g7511 [Ascochyta rabiei]UPX18584.1 hypothetical protein EKO05_0008878 [Ascochyta rabiei]
MSRTISNAFNNANLPVFNVGPRGSFRVTRNKAESLIGTTKEITTERYEAPPSYSIQVEPYYVQALRGPPKAQPSPCRTQQLQRYVLEIISITFNANFDKFNAALHKRTMTTRTSSILSDQEREDLYKLSVLVRKVDKQFSDRKISTVNEEDESTLRKAIFIPTVDITGGA